MAARPKNANEPQRAFITAQMSPSSNAKEPAMMRPKPDPVKPGQESVWDYPRPAVAEACSSRIVIEHRGVIIADTRGAVRTLETSHPPTYYIPPADIAGGALRRGEGTSFCEWKGAARYWDVIASDGKGGEIIVPRAAWSYPSPTDSFKILRDYVAFYPALFNRCSVDGETVTPQPGAFYGGWITSQQAGPFKGAPGSMGW